MTPYLSSVPHHLAIVMDGNGRWARRNNRSRHFGHRVGAKNVRPIAEACADAGVRCLTLFAMSTENLSRPKSEVNLLFNLMRDTLNSEIDELHERGTQLRFVGDLSRLPVDIQRLIDQVVQRTETNTELVLTVAVNYGGQWDIVTAAKRLAEAVSRGEVAPSRIDETLFQSYLSMSDVPPPDLCIRTGGERRLSNFLLWDFAYTEFYFSPVYWPDFRERDLRAALVDFAARDRRYGLSGIVPTRAAG